MVIRRVWTLFFFQSIKSNLIFHSVSLGVSLLITLVLAHISPYFLLMLVIPTINGYCVYKMLFFFQKHNDKVIGSKYRLKSQDGKDLEYYIKCSETERYRVPKRMYQHIVLGKKVDIVIDQKTRKAHIVLCKEKDKAL